MNWSEYFIYNTETGDLIWKERPLSHFRSLNCCGRWNTCFSGKIAGNNTRYRKVSVNDRGFFAHRIVWEMHHGPIPEGLQVDHIDENKLNNRIENLRLATGSQNVGGSNSRRVPGASGFIGVYASRERWKATITVNGKAIALGTFKDKQEARQAYLSACDRYRGAFSPNKRPQPSSSTN